MALKWNMLELNKYGSAVGMQVFHWLIRIWIRILGRDCIFLAQKDNFFSLWLSLKVWYKCHVDDMKMSPAICNLSCRRIRIIMKLWFHNLFKISFLKSTRQSFTILFPDLQMSDKNGPGSGGKKEFELFFTSFSREKYAKFGRCVWILETPWQYSSF